MIADKLYYILEELESYRKLRELLDSELKSGQLKKTKTTALAGGVMDSQKCHLACALASSKGRPMVFIAPNEIKAREICQDLEFFYPGAVKLYPAKDMLFYGADVNSGGITRGRFEVLAGLMGGRPPQEGRMAIVCSVEALFHRLTERSLFAGHIKELREGAILEGDGFLKELLAMGYERADVVEGPGQFASRGGIIDLFSPIWENPVRIELWGDEIDSLRLIDPLTQRSVDRVREITVYPAKELIYEAAAAERAAALIKGEYEELHAKYLKQGLNEEADALEETVSDALDRLGGQRLFPGAAQYAGYFQEGKTTLLDYLPEETIIFFDEPSRIEQTAETRREEFAESFKNRMEKGRLLPGQADSLLNYGEILVKSQRFSRVLLCSMATTAQTAGFTADALFSFSVKSGSTIQNRVDLLIEDLRYFMSQNYRVAILAGGHARMERLFNELTEAGFSCAKNSFDAPISISPGSLSKGFEYPLIRFAVITGGDIFGSVKPKKTGRRKDGAPIGSFADLKPGDYVVHNTHGIGVYRGIEKIISDEVARDYLKIAYADGGNLYVSAAGLDALQKYMGGDEAQPKIHKLGGQEFARAKAKVRGAVAEIAGELTELYAKREAARGHIYSADTVWQKEFEESFPYEETGDQLAAVMDIKKDMESGKVMDRLICGDVGYGKTEVAIRAAFKTVTEGRQVAFLAPTTILAQQHYNTLVQRMKDFPITIDLMSRFRNAAAQRDTASKLSSGAVDLVVGTHRLLSKDIAFKNLGLVIVDEEQRFGVAHKERLKQLRTSVNVLTLSATPIPRTLHMSLTGIRDMSVLDEPPLERLPVQTYVMEYNPEAVRDAIYRELSRKGQVYYLHNRVRNIGETAARIAKLAPEAAVAVAHGQMSERELENVMMDFIQGDIDVLVCTTIIENGLDIPNANTLIVQDADYLGLSTLYQLRGRVGRSNRPSYCYLMYRKDKVLTEASEKRLQIIRAFTEFGAGYKIALRDLSMRGAGNVLGAQQHGFMDAVGYEMYLKLLGEAVAAFKGEGIPRDFETLIDISLDAFIPPSYISNETQKLDAYRKISQITGEASYTDVWDELTDRYGDLPKCVVNLLDIAHLKAVAHSLDALSVAEKNGRLIVTFPPDARVSPERLAQAITNHKGRLIFAAAGNPTLTYRPLPEEPGHISLRRVLLELV